MNDEKFNIIFVDDEVNVLDGLRRILRSMRRTWNMTFVTSGHEALREMEKSTYNVIVSDMRMPGMDGAELLGRVKQDHPHMIRIVLSGFSDFELTLRTVNAAHQYLAKPCDGDVLVETVRRAIALRDMLHAPSIQSVVARINNLPSPPDIYEQLQRECRSKSSSTQLISAIITRDPALTAKLLQMVNSSFFGVRRAITGVEEAVRMLGIEMVKSLLAAVHVFEERHQLPPDMQYLWRHSIDTANYARAIHQAEFENRQCGDAAFTAGLLHDVGKLVLWRGLKEQYLAILDKAHGNNTALRQLEQETLGTDHGRIGAYLMGLWGLPDAIVEAVAYHHTPDQLDVSRFNTTIAVHVADAFSLTEQGRSPRPEVNHDYLSRLNLDGRLETWRAVCAEAGMRGAAA